MSIHTAIWKVGNPPEQLEESTLLLEEQLENMIIAAPRLLSDEWMLIGRQIRTAFNGLIDLLAIAPDGSLVVIELKRDRTPRDVVAQALDYACWIEKLGPEDIQKIYDRFAPGRNLMTDFMQQFGQIPDDEFNVNLSHQIIIVANSLDAITERIVGYLSARDIPINVLYFQVFNLGNEKLLSRTWLLDPIQTQLDAAVPSGGPNEPWNGEYYCSFGEGESRSWAEAVQYGFVCAGGGAWYTRTLQQLSPGNRIWVKAPGIGFLGVGLVTGQAQSALEFQVETPNGRCPVFEVLKKGNYHRDSAKDPEYCEYFVPVKWLQAVNLENAVNELGFFGNQNTVCKPTTPKWRSTVDRLKEHFRDYGKQD